MGTKEVTVCDGCGAKSPDKNGCYPANNWIRIAFEDGIEDNCRLDNYLNFSWQSRRRALILCRKCLGLPEEKWLPENLYAKGLKKLFKKHRKVTTYELGLLEEIEQLKARINDADNHNPQ